MSIRSLACLPFFLWSALTGEAQLIEDFSDGDFSAAPSWRGSYADWTINAALQLQSSNTVPNSSFYLSTASVLATSAQWEVYVNLAFNTSSANYTDIFLTASDSNLAVPSTTGYF